MKKNDRKIITKKIIVAGVPATGKTTIGNYLKEKFNFRHFDVESDEANPDVSIIGKLFWELEIDKFLEQIEKDGKDIVITWGFVCDDQRSLIILNMLQKKGFKFIWFYAEEPVARVAFLERGTGNIQDFNRQMDRIKKLNLSIFSDPIIITTLDRTGRKNNDEIIKKMLK